MDFLHHIIPPTTLLCETRGSQLHATGGDFCFIFLPPIFLLFSLRVQTHSFLHIPNSFLMALVLHWDSIPNVRIQLISLISF